MKIKLIICSVSLVITNYVLANDVATTVASLPTYQTNTSPKQVLSNNQYGNSQELTIITKGDTAKVFAASAIKLLLGGGTVSGFKKEELKGNNIEDIEDKAKLTNPLVDINTNIRAYNKDIENKYPQISKNSQFKTLKFDPILPYWSLVYDSSNKNIEKAYVLNFGSAMRSHIVDRSKNPSVNWYTNCIYKSEPLSLDAWKENDYFLVNEHRNKIINQCTETYKKHIDQAVKKFNDIEAENKKFEEDSEIDAKL